MATVDKVDSVSRQYSNPVEAEKLYAKSNKITGNNASRLHTGNDNPFKGTVEYFKLFCGEGYDWGTGNQKFSMMNDPYYITDKETGCIVEGQRTLGRHPFTGEKGFGLIA